MQLYKVPQRKDVKVRIIPEQDGTQHPPFHREFEESEVLTFSHIDGMYSLCFDADDRPVHLVAWAEVEVIEE